LSCGEIISNFAMAMAINDRKIIKMTSNNAGFILITAKLYYTLNLM